MSTWDGLKPALALLRDRQPEALRAYPDPRVDEGRVPPFHISLAAWAIDIAAYLHKQFGDDVVLHVGFQDYPSGAIRGPDPTNVRPRLLPDDIAVSIEDDIEVESGHDTSVEMHLTNHGPEHIVLHTVIGEVIDPVTDRVVGLFAGMQAAMRINYRVEPGKTVSIPILLGTASLDPQLGYSIPPGRWPMQVTFYVENQERYRTPTILMTVT
ncbi:MAG TPA: hypothetical protein VHU17_09900 [Acidimicrobiales bacterium]|nr:hypothetical protein [Acidimicrobiales bacterium]